MEEYLLITLICAVLLLVAGYILYGKLYRVFDMVCIWYPLTT